MPDKSYIFISHSTKDKEFTHFLDQQLQGTGFNTWVDVASIPEGSTWVREIEKGVESCDALIVILSKNARESEWVEREILMALKLNKPLFIALIEDVPLPIYLINRQYTDFRKRSKQAAQRLIKTLQETLLGDGVPALTPKEKARLSPKPNQHNFFKYMDQLKNGKLASLIARDLFDWASKNVDSITFSGRKSPAMHAHLWVGAGGVIIFSVRAYAQQPAIELPLQYLENFPPYNDRQQRIALLQALNRLMPDNEQFPEGKADLRPNLPIALTMDKAESLEAFKEIILDVVNNLRTADDAVTTPETDSDE